MIEIITTTTTIQDGSGNAANGVIRIRPVAEFEFSDPPGRTKVSAAEIAADIAAGKLVSTLFLAPTAGASQDRENLFYFAQYEFDDGSSWIEKWNLDASVIVGGIVELADIELVSVDQLPPFTVLGGTITPGGDAADVNYDNSASGLVATDVQAAIDELDTKIDLIEAGPFVATLSVQSTTPSFSGALVEFGATLTDLSFTASYNRTPVSTTFNAPDGDDGDASGEALAVSPADTSPIVYSAVGGADTFTKTAINATAVFSIDATDEFGLQDSNNATVTWASRTYFGAAVPATIDESFIEALSNNPLRTTKNGSFNVTAGASEKIYFCYPDQFGLSTFTVGGFEGGFVDKGTVSVTNAQGQTVDYRVYESNNAGLGATTFTVS